MSRNNGRRGRGRGRGRGNRGGRNQNIAINDILDDYLESDDSDDGLDVYAGLAIMGALGKLGYRPERSSKTVEGILQTEDGFAVNTLYVSFKSAVNVTSKLVHDWFEKFGPIKNVRIHTNQNSNMYEEGTVTRSRGNRRGGRTYNRQEANNKYAFISFKNCEDAAKCLKQKYEFQNQCFLAIADSWHQEAYHKKQKEIENGVEEAGSSSAIKSGSNDECLAPTCTSDTCNQDQEPMANKVDTNAKTSRESLPNRVESEEMNILHLNDDCLMMIFDQLDLQDLIALRKTCSRFDGIACNIFKRYKLFDFDIELIEKKYLTMLDAKTLLSEVGSFIHHLSIARDRFSKPGARILNLIPRHCPNLTELEIHDFKLTPKALKNLEVVFKSLVGLTLIDCGIDDKIDRSLKYAKKLQRLDLSLNSELTGRFLKAVGNLKYLNLESCQNIQGKPFSTFAEKNKTLEYLNINCCSRLTTDAIKSIVTNMTELSHLVCNNCYEGVDVSSMALIAKLPKLKKIQFKFNSISSIDQILQSLAEADHLEHLDLSDGIFTSVDYNLLCGLTHLKELKLNYKLDFSDQHLLKLGARGNFVELHIAGCTSVTDKQLIDFIKTNPQLKLLDISYCQITEGLIFSAIDILKEQAGNRSSGRQLKLLVGQTSICPVIKENALIQSNRHLLEISFEYTDGFYGTMDADDMYDDVMDEDDEDFMGYDYEDDDSDLWGLDYDSDLDMYQYFNDSDDDDYRYMFYDMAGMFQ
ncbi:uncharacterized protein LOC131690834 isoform X2 [Topomyia yanbarensis]|uniref:uncharacterized protein LOC131690834 isoform X2 n=1 Tax=Topomyia yanbarensis TaxID=2498891 RepID=UPI00273CC2B8|nr:uncharacterized protein LOC131690834 isoform X2 [Topomyia yanbarensis]